MMVAIAKMLRDQKQSLADMEVFAGTPEVESEMP